MALTTAHSHAIVVVGFLVRSECVFLFSSVAVGENAGGLVSLKHFQERFTGVASVPPWHTVGGEDVDPNSRDPLSKLKLKLTFAH